MSANSAQYKYDHAKFFVYLMRQVSACSKVSFHPSVHLCLTLSLLCKVCVCMQGGGAK